VALTNGAAVQRRVRFTAVADAMRCATDRSQRLNDVNGDGRMTADTRPQRVRHAAEASCCHRHHCIGHASEARMAPQPMSLMRHRRYLRALPDRVWRSYSYARWI
jgi:hypothetical protein